MLLHLLAAALLAIVAMAHAQTPTAPTIKPLSIEEIWKTP